MRECNHVQSRLFTTLASSRNGMKVVEVDDSYAGMMAVRKLADKTFGSDWGDGGWIGPSGKDACMLDSYWNWLACDEHRKIFLLYKGNLSGFSYLTYFSKMRGIEWHGFSPNNSCPRYQINAGGSGPVWMDKHKSMTLAKFNNILVSDAVMLQCYDVFTLFLTYDEYLQAITSDDPNMRRIAACHHLSLYLKNMDSEPWIRLSEDPDWRVRKAVAMNDSMGDDIFVKMAGDPDWRVRRGCCQCMAAINPWGMANVTGKRAETLVGLLDDPEFEVRVAAVEYALHAPLEVRSLAAGRLLDLKDEPLREAVMMKMLE